MAKTETSVTQLKINRGTYSNIQSNLGQIGEDELIITTDKSVPIPTANDNGKVIKVDSSGEYVLGTDENTTYSAATTSSAGLMPALDSAAVASQTQSTKFLREDGTWSAPSYSAGVTANPTLAGSEANLAGLEVGNTKYAMNYLPLSGGTLTGDVVLSTNKKIVDGNGNTILYSGYGPVCVGSTETTLQLSTGNANIQHVKKVSGASTTYDILDTSNTSANPTLSGGETVLSSLKLWGTNYAMNTADGTTIQAANGQFSVKGLPYLTTAPSADNTDGTLKLVVLTSEPATYYNGYIYKIVEAAP